MTDLSKLRQRYNAAAHAMQTGVAMEMEMEDRKSAMEPKYLRVSVNAAMVEHSALAQLLMNKGVIDELEYAEALVAGMEAEKEKYEKSLSEHFGKKITLG